ncbi:hypothetical protein M5K25_026742 [Dendrobium thyrsiflorum]|uniref:Uncharacterized protein n=1 Tax=Dendrobium thyrsiflorum TaxID=117978 RepID=A0ABD0TYE3_DENTH
MPLMYELLKCWNASKEGFIIKCHLLKFMVDEVAILTASSVEEFSSINWTWTLRDFLVNEFNKMTTKFATEKPICYINRFLPLLLVWFLEYININTPKNLDSRPQFLRWGGNIDIFYSSEKAAHLFATLKERQLKRSESAMKVQRKRKESTVKAQINCALSAHFIAFIMRLLF